MARKYLGLHREIRLGHHARVLREQYPVPAQGTLVPAAVDEIPGVQIAEAVFRDVGRPAEQRVHLIGEHVAYGRSLCTGAADLVEYRRECRGGAVVHRRGRRHLIRRSSPAYRLDSGIKFRSPGLSGELRKQNPVLRRQLRRRNQYQCREGAYLELPGHIFCHTKIYCSLFKVLRSSET